MYTRNDLERRVEEAVKEAIEEMKKKVQEQSRLLIHGYIHVFILYSISPTKTSFKRRLTR